MGRRSSTDNRGEPEERYRLLFSSINDAILVHEYHADGSPEIFVEVNDVACERLGYTRDELLHMSTNDIDAPEGLAAVPAAMKKLTAEGRAVWEGMHLTKDGRKIPVEISNRLFELDGKPMIFATIRDITDRRRAEERIQNLARFPDENPNPVMRVSVDGSLLYHNPSSRSLLPSWVSGPDGRMPAAHLPALMQAWEAGEKGEIEVREGRKTFAITIAPIRAAGYINLYAKDVTEEKSLAEKFMQAQKMEAIGRLAGGIAHDFNNVLTVISGYCDLVRSDLPKGSLVESQVGEIALAAEKAAALTTQLLAFSRKQVLIPQVVDTNELVKKLETIVGRVVGEDIELKTFLHPGTGNLRADPGQIEQALMNLVVNARDAMPAGGNLTIETSMRVFDEAYAREHADVKPGEYVRIAVSDTGVGMDREVLSHIFEPFFTTKEQGKGTGLGLSTVYGIVKQSGGAITCYSEPGKGSTFTIYFPRTGEPRGAVSAPMPGTPQRGTETILLVEDEEAVRAFARTVLERNGYRVLEAAGGIDALARVATRESEVDLLVTDVVMPHMSGQELARNLVRLSPRAKVLYVSGYTGNAILLSAILGKGTDFLQKPFSSRELLVKIREMLDARS
ncbi:MAG TPA: ATP-binding protein [Spirochaetia bacterium]|nr:ATP-binding protein [Spirochaetia bacterium]